MDKLGKIHVRIVCVVDNPEGNRFGTNGAELLWIVLLRPLNERGNTDRAARAVELDITPTATKLVLGIRLLLMAGIHAARHIDPRLVRFLGISNVLKTEGECHPVGILAGTTLRIDTLFT